MEFLKQVFNNNDENNCSNYSIVDVYNKKKFQVLKYFDFLLKFNEAEFHLAEVPLYPSPLIVDVDIKELGTVPTSLYTFDVVEEIISSYVAVLNKHLLIKPENYKILLLEKDPRIVDQKYIKHGFHLHFISLSLSKVDLKRVHKLVKDICDYGYYIDDVSAKPWLLYGATKAPGEEPYKITKGFVVEDDDDIFEVPDYRTIFYKHKFNGIEITKDNLEKMLRAAMSIRASKLFTVQIPNELEAVQDDLRNVIIDTNIQHEYVNISDDILGELVLNLKQERSDDYNEWVKVGMILSSIAKQRLSKGKKTDYLKGLFHIFSRKSNVYDENDCENKWNSLMNSTYEGGVGIGSLIFMAKEDGNFKSLKELVYKTSRDFIPLNDYDIAKTVKNTITDLYITHKDFGCYKFDKTIWKEVSGWENIFKQEITSFGDYFIKKMRSDIEDKEFSTKEDMSEDEAKEIDLMKKNLGKFEKKVKNYSSLNNICKSLSDLYFDEKIQEIFVQKEDKIALQNCVFDISNWKVVSPDPDHYFGLRVEHELIDWVDVPEDNKTIVLDFWNKIFPDPELRSYCLKNFARFFTGKNSFKQFQFWTGTGNNGKSVCIKLMEYMFGRMTMKVPKSIVTGVSNKPGAVNPEVFRLKDSKLAIIDEVTNNDFLDPGQIKGLTGNDKLYGRDLYQRSKDIKEITPLFFPILITNETPIIKRPDDATWERIRLIKFESKFKSQSQNYLKNNPHEDPSKVFESNPRIDEILKNNAKYFISHLFSIIFEYSSFDDFNKEEILPEKVIEGLNNFKQGQNIIKQYIDENYVVDATSKELISCAKLLRDYNASRPRVTLSMGELETAIKNYSLVHPEVILNNNVIKGFSRVDF